MSAASRDHAWPPADLFDSENTARLVMHSSGEATHVQLSAAFCILYVCSRVCLHNLQPLYSNFTL